LGNDAASTEVIAQMMQGAAHTFLALNYDRAFVVHEDVTTPEQLAALQLATRAEVRDSGVAMLERGITQAKAASFTTATSVFAGPQYTANQLAKVMRTMQAEALALWPRSAEENAQVDWNKVAEYASQGVSSNADGAPFEWQAFVSEASWNDSGL